MKYLIVLIFLLLVAGAGILVYSSTRADITQAQAAIEAARAAQEAARAAQIASAGQSFVGIGQTAIIFLIVLTVVAVIGLLGYVAVLRLQLRAALGGAVLKSSSKTRGELPQQPQVSVLPSAQSSNPMLDQVMQLYIMQMLGQMQLQPPARRQPQDRQLPPAADPEDWQW